MAGDTKHTFLCAVAAVALVGYAKQDVSGQVRLRGAFTTRLLEAIAHMPADTRIIVDTGGGAVVSFLDDPEDALFAVLQLHAAIQPAYADEYYGKTMRACINLGPVLLSRD